jgi:uncharacterized membrane protein
VSGHPVLWLVAGAATWASAMMAAPLFPEALASPVYAAASVVCHQLAARTFHLDAGPVAVCARCLGLYLGGVAGFAAVAVRSHRIQRFRAPLFLLAAAATPTAATLAAEWLLAWPLGNLSRFVAALPLGLAVAMTIGSAVAADSRAAADLQAVR